VRSTGASPKRTQLFANPSGVADQLQRSTQMAWGFAYLLKNRFYIGEVVYRGEVHGGEQAPSLFETEARRA
jgi:hypothetical protein